MSEILNAHDYTGKEAGLSLEDLLVLCPDEELAAKLHANGFGEQWKLHPGELAELLERMKNRNRLRGAT